VGPLATKPRSTAPSGGSAPLWLSGEVVLPSCDKRPSHLKPKQFARVRTGNRRYGVLVERLDRSQMTKGGVGFGHVERIVGAHHNMIGAENLNQRIELLRREHDAVDKNVLEIVRRRMRQISTAIGPSAPGVIDAVGICTEVSAAVHGKQLQIGVTFEHTVEDQIVERERRLEGIADHVIEVMAREALPFGEAIRVQNNKRAELFGFLPERLELRRRQLSTRDIGEHLSALQPKFTHRPFQLGGCLVAIRQRNAAQADETIRLSCNVFRDALVEDTGCLDRDVKRHL
jgi:hypothetical protein